MIIPSACVNSSSPVNNPVFGVAAAGVVVAGVVVVGVVVPVPDVAFVAGFVVVDEGDFVDALVLLVCHSDGRNFLSFFAQDNLGFHFVFLFLLYDLYAYNHTARLLACQHFSPKKSRFSEFSTT